MNKNLKKILITSASLLLLASVGTNLNNVNASHNIGWRKISRVTNIANYGKRIHLKKNQHVYVINLNKNKRYAKIKIGHRYYTLKTNHLVLDTNAKKAINKYKKFDKQIMKKHSRRYTNKRKNNVRRLAKQSKQKSRHNFKKAKNNNNVLRPKFRRSNNRRLLNRSGFVNLMKYESTAPDFMNKYAPNDKRAVVPKNLNIKNMFWLQGKMMQKNPTVYQYSIAKRGWIIIG